MNKQKAMEFFDKEVKTRFPNWRPGDALIADWVSWLIGFDYNAAKEAIKRHVFKSRLTYPVLNDFYAEAKKLQRKLQCNKQPSLGLGEPILLYSLQSEDEPADIRYFYIQNAIPSEDKILAEVERIRKMHEALYGGKFRIIRNWKNIGKEKPDDGLTGQKAMLQAEQNVLAGPDTSGRSWLLKIRGIAAQPKTKKQNAREPVLIGDILDDVPF